MLLELFGLVPPLSREEAMEARNIAEFPRELVARMVDFLRTRSGFGV